MITISNLRQLLEKLHFTKEENRDYYKKYYTSYEDCFMAVDFESEKLIFPTQVLGRERNTGFDKDEYFVVFECVDRLLTKGYRPETIELEKVWTLGHTPKGGRADICVYASPSRDTMLFILECKTYGAKFKEAIKETREDGGQIFSYWQQERSTKWLGIYASDLKNDEVIYECPIVNCTDDANILKLAKKDESVMVYANPSVAGNAKNLHEVWTETYLQEFLDDLIFNEETIAYEIGIKPLRKKNLKEFNPDDQIVNRFEEILRHNNVSDKENAFNRLVALFICKLVDEISKSEDDIVEFQYRIGTDTYETLQDRLQRLHKQGMEDFMKEKIFYVEADYAERLFQQYTGRQRKAAIEDLKSTIRILKFYSNNDFAFKDVHNEELFFQNGKILVEVVQLFQRYKIVYPSKHQFLGNMFEQLLNKGFKQNEGQFFTPMPITRFIWDSLPLQDFISKHGLPKVIDYSCGAGHFLTEAVAAIDEVRNDSDNAWVEKHIWGIEKDYRLARVSKISMFMNGAGGGNIIFGDGLENYPEKEINNGFFDILVANPPYSVNSFKAHLKLKNNKVTILDYISNDGSEIETLFVERAAQLLKPGGLAAIILPETIMTKSIGSYIAARSVLLRNFNIRAIVHLQGKTFGATDTPTKVLFLQRFLEPPKIEALAEDVANDILSGQELVEWEDMQILKEYLELIGVDETVYESFRKGTLSVSSMNEDVYFKLYVENFLKGLADDEREDVDEKQIVQYIKEVEHEKLIVFTIVRNQQTVFVSAPVDNKEQKKFLGYEWSTRKRHEGLFEREPGGKMYNANDRFAEGTIASKIRKSFFQEVESLSEELEKYTATYPLKNMIDFSLPTFNLCVDPNAKIETKIQTKYDLIRLNDTQKFALSIGRRILSTEVTETAKYPVFSANVREPFGKIDKLLITDFTIDSVLWGIDGDWMVAYMPKNKPFFPTDHCGVLRVLDSTIDPYYVAQVLGVIGVAYGFSRSYRASTERIASVQIPLPPKDIRDKIVKQCKKIDKEFNSTRMSIEAYNYKIAEVFKNTEVLIIQQ